VSRRYQALAFWLSIVATLLLAVALMSVVDHSRGQLQVQLVDAPAPIVPSAHTAATVTAQEEISFPDEVTRARQRSRPQSSSRATSPSGLVTRREVFELIRQIKEREPPQALKLLVLLSEISDDSDPHSREALIALRTEAKRILASYK
jgi:hypothetical protein